MLTFFAIVLAALLLSTALALAVVTVDDIGDRYADMVDDPTRTLGQILALLSVAPGGLVLTLVLLFTRNLSRAQARRAVEHILIAPFRAPRY